MMHTPRLLQRLTRRAVLLAALVVVSSAAPAAQGGVWEPLTTGTTADLYGVHFASDATGYVAGAGGAVLKTTNFGQSWQDVSLSDGRDLFDVHFFDADVGLVVGAEGAIWRTTDGGATWAPVAGGTSEPIHAVSFSGSVGIAGAGGQTILRSEDQGATWAVVQDGFFGPPFFGAHMRTPTDGFLAGQNAIFQPLFGASSDGGQTWDFATFYFNSNEGAIRDVEFLDAQRGFAVGATFDGQGAVAETADRGQSWTTLLFPDALYGVGFIGAEGYAVGAAGSILYTSDGGQNWATVLSGTEATLHALALPSGDVGYAAGSGGMVLRGDLVPNTAAPDGPAVPAFGLEASGPNPFRGRTTIRYALADPGPVALRVYDTLGREVAVLVNGPQAPGLHEVVFDAWGLRAGVYFVRLEAGLHAATRALLRLR